MAASDGTSNNTLQNKHSYYTAMIEPVMSKEYALIPLIKNLFPSMTAGEIDSYRGKNKAEILKACFDKNQARTFKRAIDNHIWQISNILHSYMLPALAGISHAKTKNDFLRYTNLFWQLREKYLHYLEDSGQLMSMDNNFYWNAGSDVYFGPEPRGIILNSL